MKRQVLPQAGREVDIRSQDEWESSVSRGEHASSIRLALISLRNPQSAVSSKLSLPMTRMTLRAIRGLGQWTPVSSVHIDKGLENQRVLTTPELVPLLALAIAALPVPAHADVLASLTAATSLASSRWVKF